MAYSDEILGLMPIVCKCIGCKMDWEVNKIEYFSQELGRKTVFGRCPKCGEKVYPVSFEVGSMIFEAINTDDRRQAKLDIPVQLTCPRGFCGEVFSKDKLADFSYNGAISKYYCICPKCELRVFVQNAEDNERIAMLNF